MYDDILGKEEKEKKPLRRKRDKPLMAPVAAKAKKPQLNTATPTNAAKKQLGHTDPRTGQSVPGIPTKPQPKSDPPIATPPDGCPDCGDSLADCDCEDEFDENEFDENDKWDAGGSKSK
jgi:hypothetical protein